MKKLLAIILLLPSLCFAAAESKTYNGVADSSVKLILGNATAGVKTANAVDWNDGDSTAGTWTHIADSYGTGTATQSVSTSGSINAQVGDVLVCYVAWFGGAVTGLSVGNGTETFTLQTTHNYSNSYGTIGHLIVTSAANAAVTASWTTARNQAGVTVMQFRPSQTATLDAGPGSAGNISADPTTANVTTAATGTILAVAGCYGDNGDTPSARTIAGATATGYAGTHTHMAYLISPANNTSINAVFTEASNNWVADILTFKD